MIPMDEHELYDVVAFKIVDDYTLWLQFDDGHEQTMILSIDDYTLWLQFDDGHEQTIDFEPVLYGEVFAPLRTLALFNQVVLNPDTGTIEWPTGADFDPETLHNWPKYVDEIIQRRKELALAVVPI